MRSFSTRIALSLLLAASTAGAQPDTRDHRQHRPPPPPAAVDTGPTSAPPAPQNEAVTPKAGYTWISGRWDWKNGKWAWTAGHWERERAGKKWRTGRWDQHDNKWSWVDGEWVDASQPPAPPQPPPPVVTGPTQAPPPPRDEKWQPRKGFVYVAGNWDWKNGKWEWVAGHWEREQAGKKWRTSRWEQRDGKWARVDGGWEDDHAAPPQPPPPSHGRGRHDWKLERPVISSYWPAKGKAGTRITIKGKNFPKDAQVMFAGQPVKAAKVTANQIMFVLPANATSGAITLQADARRQLAVGQFEVVASYDPVAEQRRIDEERQKAAEAAWKARQSQLAKDRAAREAAMRQAMEERAATRERRRAEIVAQIQAKFQRDFLADDDTQDELTLHAQRVAELTRARDVAEVSANGKLVVRIDVAMGRENQRHDERMDALEAAFKVRGGQR